MLQYSLGKQVGDSRECHPLPSSHNASRDAEGYQHVPQVCCCGGENCKEGPQNYAATQHHLGRVLGRHVTTCGMVLSEMVMVMYTAAHLLTQQAVKQIGPHGGVDMTHVKETVLKQ